MLHKKIDFAGDAFDGSYDAGGEVLGLLQTEHSGIGFNPFVNASHTDAERHYFGKDHLGSIRAVTNQWGSPLYMFDYDVFGQPLQDRPERFRHGFTGKEFDSWTGLYDYGFRDYSPLSGRFTTVDPIQDGHNWYAYAVSDPVNWLDNWGLCPTDAESGEDTAATNVNPAHWRDNGDGTWTAISEGATLWEVWGPDWKEKSGFTRDPKTLQVGETVGVKKAENKAELILHDKNGAEVFSKMFFSVENIHEQPVLTTWLQKKDNELLNSEEASLQRKFGITEMILGPILGIGLTALGQPEAFLLGMYAMADGAIVYTEANKELKKAPVISIPKTFMMPLSTTEDSSFMYPTGGTNIW